MGDYVMIEIADLKKHHVDECMELARHLWHDPDIIHSIYDEMWESYTCKTLYPLHYIVAFDSVTKDVTGFAGFRRALFMKDAWENTWLAVDKNRQRQGIGRVLAEARFDMMRHMGGKYVISSNKDPLFSFSTGNKCIDIFDSTNIMAKIL